MIAQNVDSRKWISRASEKLKSFLERSPLLVSNITGQEDGKDGVFIVIESYKLRMFFPYEYGKEPKVWVHDVKTALIPYYPRLLENITEAHFLSMDEKVDRASSLGTIENLPDYEDRVIKRYCWRIDKVLLYRDIFILFLEGITTRGMDGKDVFQESSEHIMRRYKYCSSSVLFLNKLRSNEMKNMDMWSKEFFENSVPLDNLKIRDS